MLTYEHWVVQGIQEVTQELESCTVILQAVWYAKYTTNTEKLELHEMCIFQGHRLWLPGILHSWSSNYRILSNKPACLNKRVPSTFWWNISLKIGKNWSKTRKTAENLYNMALDPRNSPGWLSTHRERLFGEIRFIIMQIPYSNLPMPTHDLQQKAFSLPYNSNQQNMLD